MNKAPKISENKTKKIECRISEADYKLLKVSAYMMGNSVSGLIRLLVQTAVNSLKLKIAKGELNLEDFEAVFDD